MANDILEELKGKLGKDNFAGCAAKGDYAAKFREIAEILLKKRYSCASSHVLGTLLHLGT